MAQDRDDSQINAGCESEIPELVATAEPLAAVLRESDAREALDSFFNLSVEMLCILDFDGRFKRLNPAFERILGYDRQELRGTSLLEWVHPDDRDFTATQLEQLTRGDEAVSFENRFPAKDGETKWLLWNASTDGEEKLIYAAAHDITKRKRAEETAHRSEERYRSLIAATTAIVWSTSASGEFETEQDEWSAFTGQSWDELKGWGWLNAIHPLDQAHAARVWSAAVESRSAYQVEHRLRRHDGQYRDMMVRGVPVLEADGSIHEWIGVHTDITESKQAEVELRAMAQQLEAASQANQRIMDYSLDVICTVDETGHFIQVSAASQKIWGYAPAELADQPFIDFVYEDDRAKTNQVALDILSGRATTNFENRYLRRDGSLVPMVWSAVWSPDDKIMFCVARDNTERKEAEAELEKARDAAEAGSRAKSEFLANMSHELRTPLNAIIGFSEVLEDLTFGELNPRQARYVTNILTSGRHLLQLINDILDIAKIEAGRLTLDRTPFSAGVALNDVVAIVKTLANKKSIELSVEAPDDLPILKADQPKFKQIMYNLMSNAIKFTPPEGRVSVIAQLEGAGNEAAIRISVTDTGIGIQPEDHERVFGQFEQVDSSYSRQQQGTGLGLALTKNLVELHGGRIWVESEGIEGQGSTFAFVLPLEEAKPIEAPSPVVADAPSAEMADADQSTSAPLVLVVEDNGPASELLTHYLTEAGYAVAHAGDGEQAVQMVRELRPYAVTLDIMLPKKDGWQVLGELKAMAETCDVPVIIISMTEDRQLGVSLGALDFMVKPVDKERLIEVIAKAGMSTGKQAMTILVVDDEPKTVELLTDLLRHQGFGVVPAYGGQQGIDLAIEKRPDVIILDLMMPDVTGFEVVRQLQEHPEARDIPIIIFSAKDITEEERGLLTSGIQSIVPKSGKDELLHELEKIKVLQGDI